MQAISARALYRLIGAILTTVTFSSGPAISAAGTLKLYWSDGAIRRADLDGSDTEQILQSPWGEHPNIAFDPVEQKMYWSSAQAGGIERANYDGTDVETVINGVSTPREVTIDAVNRKAYWIDYGTTASIWRGNLDGTGRELLVSNDSSPPIAIAVDPTNNCFYWSGFKGDINRASYDGSQVQTVNFSAWFTGTGLAIDSTNGYIYASGFSQNAIIRMRSSDLSDDLLWVTQGVSNPTGIVIDTVDERVIWVNSLLSSNGTTISSVDFNGMDQRIDFYPQIGSFNTPIIGAQLAIVGLPTPEPTSITLGGAAGLVACFAFGRRRR